MDVLNVGTVARLSGVSVRALHHYEQIGLLVPAGRAANGYRTYSAADVARLRQILFYRELAFGLDQIAEILADPQTGAEEHLRRQHRLLHERRENDQRLIEAIEKELEARRMGIGLTPQEQLEIFGPEATARQEEAARRWGSTEEWAQSQRRKARYGKQDWAQIKAQAEANSAGFAAALRAGEPADGAVATDLAEAHREHIARWFYELDHAVHRGLADMYAADPRFYAEQEAANPGFTRYLQAAIHANADRRGADSWG